MATATIEKTIGAESGIRTIPCRYAGRCGGACRESRGDVLDPAIFAELDCVAYHRRRGFLVFLLVAFAAAALGFWLAFAFDQRQGLGELKTFGDEQLHRWSTRLEREIDKFGILPLTVAMDRDVTSFLTAPDQSEKRDALSAYLARLNAAAGTQQVFVIDTKGEVVASSNWQDAKSFVGRNISYRPYFRDAQTGKLTGYYAIGTTGNAPGYYLATAVEENGRRIGVVAVKIDLEQLEFDWLNGTDEPILMTDANDIVVLSSREDWKYRSLGPLDPKKIEQMNETQQYNRHIVEPLVWQVSSKEGDGRAFIVAGDRGGTRTYLADSRYVPSVAMTLTVLSDTTGVTVRAAERATVAAVLILLAALSVRIVNQRRLATRERLLARDALQEAYNYLERQFEERNRQLRSANEELRHEVVERIKAARRLQSFQDEMIRTENLAVIGQLSAGLAHEINQPLAALSTLSENAVRFLELNDTSTVRHNLERICDLVRRMGVLTGQLRSFARRTDGELGPVDLHHSIESAVALLGHRIKKEKVDLVIHKPERPIKAMGDTVRLEQVLVNLISNAMDALHGNGEPRIEIAAGVEGEWAVIDVVDNGHGLSRIVMEKLFEPFFTTKKTSGLGLGLAISQDIVRRFGGDLTAANTDAGGARFRVSLRPVAASEKEHG
ncbi:ATP-binding protein [Xanthobacter oligotrophicus]|uniref:ATP-binding protein n=1 Tax=Xanthobacter oligotrophicus TaxID=2607286 RepID=UPI0011F1AF8B|nr:ATP-binding protein [Xanthobacter oligotrophicus]MCG5237234.1 ATP-binding protein [Xanthobacter oligotrophicus]